MFVGRQEELKAMERLYQKDGFQMLVLYGRRRIGKTTLLEEFAKNKPILFFTAKEQSSSLNLRDFSQAIFSFFHISDAVASFESWAAAFAFIADMAKDDTDRLLFVFDEFPYAAGADPSLPSILQVAIDHNFKGKNILLVLSGSNEGFMESKVLGAKSPLYGRRTAQIKLLPFDYFDAAAMVPSVSDPTTLINYYAVFGGTPYYLAQIDENISFQENIEELFYQKSGLLYEEPLMLLRQELREPSFYNSILYAVAAGATSPKRIAEQAGVEATTTSRYLKTLEDLGLVSRLVPFGENARKTRKSLYRLSDPFFSYWYRFVGPNVDAVEVGAGSALAQRNAFGENFSTYVGLIFENVCQQWMQRANRNRNLPFLATAFGKWWGTDSRLKEQTDIDVVAADRQSRSIALGECKWRNSFDETDAIEKLVSRAELIKGYDNQWFYMFSKDVVSKGTIKKYSSENMFFIDSQQLFDKF